MHLCMRCSVRMSARHSHLNMRAACAKMTAVLLCRTHPISAAVLGSSKEGRPALPGQLCSLSEMVSCKATLHAQAVVKAWPFGMPSVIAGHRF